MKMPAAAKKRRVCIDLPPGRPEPSAETAALIPARIVRWYHLTVPGEKIIDYVKQLPLPGVHRTPCTNLLCPQRHPESQALRSATRATRLARHAQSQSSLFGVLANGSGPQMDPLGVVRVAEPTARVAG